MSGPVIRTETCSVDICSKTKSYFMILNTILLTLLCVLILAKIQMQFIGFHRLLLDCCVCRLTCLALRCMCVVRATIETSRRLNTRDMEERYLRSLSH
jgi:hypothetical protein